MKRFKTLFLVIVVIATLSITACKTKVNNDVIADSTAVTTEIDTTVAK